MAKKAKAAVKKGSAVKAKAAAPAAKGKAAPVAKKDNTMAIIGLILNILILPGLGTLIGCGPEHKKDGIIQLVMFVVGVFLSIVLIGIPLVIAAWVWALVTSIKTLQA